MTSTPSASRSKPSAKVAPTTGPAAARITRLRSAKEGSASPALATKPTGFLAKGKEGLRKVSDKIKEKEKETEKDRVRPAPIPETPNYSESLQVGPPSCCNVRC